MRNPFRSQPEPFEGLEERIAAVLGTVRDEQPTNAAHESARSQLLSRLDAPPTGNGQGRRRALATAGAVLAPLVLITAAAAMNSGGGGNANPPGLTANAHDTSTSTNTATATPTSGHKGHNDKAADTTTATTTSTSTSTTTTTTNANATTTITPTGQEAVQDAHTNGHGCDDTLFANGTPPFATPGGPAGCAVGNSADHRQNGATATPSVSAQPSSSEDNSGSGISLSGGVSVSIGSSGLHISAQGNAHRDSGNHGNNGHGHDH